MLARTRRLLKDNSGVAMIYSLVIGMVVAIFAVMLLMVTYSLYAASVRQNGQTQCRIMADSYAECLKGEIDDHESDVYKYICEQLKAKEEEIELDLVQGNYTIYTTFINNGSGAGSSSSSDKEDEKDTIKDDNDDPDPSDINVTPTPIVTPSPSVTPAGSGNNNQAAPLGKKYELIATIKCNKGGTGGIDEQSYTLTQTYEIRVE